jgi:hypothetical protein
MFFVALQQETVLQIFEHLAALHTRQSVALGSHRLLPFSVFIRATYCANLPHSWKKEKGIFLID